MKEIESIIKRDRQIEEIRLMKPLVWAYTGTGRRCPGITGGCGRFTGGYAKAARSAVYGDAGKSAVSV